MKILLFAAIAVIISTGAQACTPSDSDFESLATSPSHLTPNGFSALAPADQKSVCLTRAYIKWIDDKNGVIDDLGGPYSIKYLTSAELKRVNKAGDDYLLRLLKAKGH